MSVWDWLQSELPAQKVWERIIIVGIADIPFMIAWFVGGHYLWGFWR